MSTGSQHAGNEALEDVRPTDSGTVTARSASSRNAANRRWVIAAVFLIGILAVYSLIRLTSNKPADGGPAAASAEALNQSFQHYQAGRYLDAVVSAKVALTLNPASAEAQNNLAVSYLGLGKYDEALQSAQEAIRLDPKSELAKNNLAWIQREKAAASVTPSPSATFEELLNQSLQHAQASRFKACVDTATLAAKLNPNSAEAFNNIGFCAGNMQQWDEANRALQEALRLKPDFSLARNNLNWLQTQRATAATPQPTKRP